MNGEELSIQVTDAQGITHRIPALAGWRIMEIIRDAGLPIKAECGGACSCATCHVYVDPAWTERLDPARTDERDLITDHAVAPQATSRLSCQILMRDDLNGLHVTLAP
jgi:ferredoxin, 2Fe-2S